MNSFSKSLLEIINIFKVKIMRENDLQTFIYISLNFKTLKNKCVFEIKFKNLIKSYEFSIFRDFFQIFLIYFTIFNVKNDFKKCKNGL